MNKKTVGIIGGVGPAATSKLFDLIIKNTYAQCDNDHIHIIIDNNTSIPDRTKAILNNTNDPVREIVKSINKLKQSGADLFAIPCVTAHFYFEEIVNETKINLINIIEEMALLCKKNKINKVGIMATKGTCKAKLFDSFFLKNDIDVFYPNEDELQQLMFIIYKQVKAGVDANPLLMQQYIDRMKKNGVDTIILGCTELPLVFKNGFMNMRFVDSLEVCAKAIIKKAGYKIKNE